MSTINQQLLTLFEEYKENSDKFAEKGNKAADNYDDFGATSRQISFSVHYKKADLIAESEELQFTNFMVAHPCKSLLCGYAFLGLCMFLSL